MLILAAILLISLSSFAQAQYYACSGGYKIQLGDTFSKLAYNDASVTCAWINANPGVDPCKLIPGQCVNSPIVGYTKSQCDLSVYSCGGYNNYYWGNWGSNYYTGPYYNTGYNSGNNGYYYSNPYGYGTGNWQCGSGQHVIQEGEYLWKLANGDRAAVCAWLSANPGVNVYDLKPGYCLNQPTSVNYNNPNCYIP